MENPFLVLVPTDPANRAVFLFASDLEAGRYLMLSGAAPGEFTADRPATDEHLAARLWELLLESFEAVRLNPSGPDDAAEYPIGIGTMISVVEKRAAGDGVKLVRMK